MKYGFKVYKTEVEDHVFWVAESKDLKGCVGQGESLEEAVKELADNENQWIDAAREYGIKIPEPTIDKAPEYSGKFVTRVSSQVHREAAENAKKEGISLNQYVNNAIVAMNTCGSTQGVFLDFISKTQSKFGFKTDNKISRRNLHYRSTGESNFFSLAHH